MRARLFHLLPFDVRCGFVSWAVCWGLLFLSFAVHGHNAMPMRRRRHAKESPKNAAGSDALVLDGSFFAQHWPLLVYWLLHVGVQLALAIYMQQSASPMCCMPCASTSPSWMRIVSKSIHVLMVHRELKCMDDTHFVWHADGLGTEAGPFSRHSCESGDLSCELDTVSLVLGTISIVLLVGMLLLWVIFITIALRQHRRWVCTHQHCPTPNLSLCMGLR